MISSAELYSALEDYGVDAWLGVPYSRLKSLINALPASAVVLAPREDLAVAAAFGVALAGGTPALFMKDAGLGHCIDALTTTFALAGLPYLAIVSTDQTNLAPAHHRIWGAMVESLLAAVGLDVLRLSSASLTDLLALLEAAKTHQESAALLVDDGSWE